MLNKTEMFTFLSLSWLDNGLKRTATLKAIESEMQALIKSNPIKIEQKVRKLQRFVGIVEN